MADQGRVPGTRAVVAAGLLAQVSVATVGALPWAVLPVAALGYVGATELAGRSGERHARRLRWTGNALALLAVAVLAPLVVRASSPAEVKQELGLMLMATQIGQALGWRQHRDVRSGLMASFGLLVLSASYAPDVLVGIPVLAGWAAIVIALALLGGLGRTEAVRTAAAAVALGLVAYLLVPATPTQAAQNRLARLAGDSLAGSRLTPNAFGSSELDLRRRGELTSAGVLQVPGDSPALWRATSFDRYDGTSWTRSANPQLVPGSGPVFQVSDPGGRTRTDVAERIGSGRTPDGTVWSPGQVVAVGADELARAVVDEQGAVQLLGGAATYTVTSREPVTDLAALRSRRGEDATDPRWRSLPPTLPPRVVELARRLTADSQTRYDAAGAIASYLRSTATYRLDSPVPGPGEDAVDRFLFVDKTGFCEQFASAQVVLLRAAGVPARLVAGLAYGTPVGDRKLFRMSDLHTWTELWVPGVGWVSSDPTAGVPLAGGLGQSLRQQVASRVNLVLRQLMQVPGGRYGLAAGLLVLAAASTLRWRRRPAGRRTRTPVTLPAGPALSAFLRLDERLGEKRRRESESLRELGCRLGPGLAGALAVVERECYGPQQPTAHEVSAAVAVLDRASPGARAGTPPGGRRAPRGPRAGP